MAHPLTNNFLRVLFPTLLLLLLVGLQSAFGCLNSTVNERYIPLVQVNACHLDFDALKVPPCCDSAICHRSSTPQRHLGSPEFANRIKDILPLILETRHPVPEPRTGLAFNHDQIDQHSTYQTSTTSTAPRHALSFLRTTILLH